MGNALKGLSFGKKPPPKFASEGEPENESGGGAQGGEPDGDEAPEGEGGPEGGDMPGEGGDKSYDEHKELALDDMADILGVSPEDRKDFGSALSAFFHASMMSLPDEGADEGPPAGMSEGPPEGMEAGEPGE
jgi:hypothetical protein